MNTDAMFSSVKQDWETPREFMDRLPVRFDLDSCATDERVAQAPKWFTPADNGLVQEWRGRVWMNSPYGKWLPTWLQKAYSESLQEYNKEVWCLCPARTDTKWFHAIATKGSIYLLKGRIDFLNMGLPMGSPAFPSMLVVFNRMRIPIITTWDWKKEPFPYKF